MPCSPVKVNQPFGGTHRLHLQGRRVNEEINQQEVGSKLCQFLPWLVLKPWRWKIHVLPKLQSTFTGLYDVIENTDLFTMYIFYKFALCDFVYHINVLRLLQIKTDYFRYEGCILTSKRAYRFHTAVSLALFSLYSAITLGLPAYTEQLRPKCRTLLSSSRTAEIDRPIA
jgi:hypothetical protein